jgi:hypothetical protein
METTMQSMKRMTLWSAIALALMSAFGCANDLDAPKDPSLSDVALVDSQSLELTVRTETAVAGVYRHGSVVIRFDTAKSETGSNWVLYQGDGKELFRVEQVSDAVVTTTLGAYRQRTSAELLAKLKTGQMDEAAAMNGIATDGDASLVMKLRSLPEFAEIPALSQALARRGITGKAYPTTFALHSLGSQVQRELGQAAAAAADPSSKTPQGFAPGTLPPQCYTSGNQTCCRPNASSPYHCGPTQRPELTCEDLHPLPDLNCDPNHDNCFGLCGDGCDCWIGLCGDCTYHWACAQHDWFCRKAQGASWYEWLYNPLISVYASQCYGGLSTFVALAGCQ